MGASHGASLAGEPMQERQEWLETVGVAADLVLGSKDRRMLLVHKMLSVNIW